MNLHGVINGLILGVSSSLLWLMPLPLWANPITPESGSPTQVSTDGHTYTITGGALSGDGQNLFHSFEQFGLSQGQIANFLTQPDVQAVLGRIVGGDASYIDGLLQVTGSSADLYLINSAGILFGPSAALNLSGSFAAVTASGVQFSGGSFDVIGNPDYAQLVGDPTGFVFATATTGAVVNAGNLTVSPGESIVLLGGQVISTGTVRAPGGTITIAAVPGENRVRISQDGMVLSLILETLPAGTVADVSGLDPLSLPALLTGGDGGNGGGDGVVSATGIAVLADGSVALTGGTLTVPDQPGVVAVAGTVDAAGTVGGTVAVVGDRVGLTGATVDASGITGGGRVNIGGAFQGQPTLPASQITYVDSDSVIMASALEPGDGDGDGIGTGTGGAVILWSDGITGFYGDILAEAGAHGGDGGLVEVSGLETLQFRGTVSTHAPQGQTGTLLLDPTNITIRDGNRDGDDADNNPNLLSDLDIQLTDDLPTIIYESELEGISGDTNLIIRASNNIVIEDIADNAIEFPRFDPYTHDVSGSISFEAGGEFLMEDTQDTILARGRNVSIDAETIRAGIINTENSDDDSGNIEINADGNIYLEGTITHSDSTFFGGRINLVSTNGDIVVQRAIEAGRGGVFVNAGRRFQVLGTIYSQIFVDMDDLNSPNNQLVFDFLANGDPDRALALLDYFSNNSEIVIELPVSIVVEEQDGRIEIMHGGQVNSIGSDDITIDGSGSYPDIQFIVGPQPQGQLDLADFPQATGFQALTVGSSLFPSNMSGTAGAILRGGTRNTFYYSSFQNQPFIPTVIPSDPPAISNPNSPSLTVETIDPSLGLFEDDFEDEAVQQEDLPLLSEISEITCTSQFIDSDEAEMVLNRVEIFTSCERSEFVEP